MRSNSFRSRTPRVTNTFIAKGGRQRPPDPWSRSKQRPPGRDAQAAEAAAPAAPPPSQGETPHEPNHAGTTADVAATAASDDIVGATNAARTDAADGAAADPPLPPTAPR